MSVNQLEAPNNLNLFCGSLTSSQGLSVTGGTTFLVNNAEFQTALTVANLNPSAVGNGLNVLDNNGNIAFAVGYNNSIDVSYLASYLGDMRILTTTSGSPIERYRFLGTTGGMTGTVPLSFAIPGFNAQYWTGQTIGAVATVVKTFPTSTGGVYSFNTTAQGTDITSNLAVLRNQWGLIRNVSGTLTAVGGALTTTVTASDTGLTTASVTYAISGTNVNVTVNGVAGETINWTGYTIVSN